ncbi:uncharacterized protein LOC122569595 isoform X1 [Bombus pyrosoma]|uniref:uncharacterized protein LOC122569595 isoform X1 n=1 Tax=Bombus pyrosoma TaxID=396416 RepID=UPI001CB8A605|nr:uncharacterized protein LOC122569595 isoform X1 [Bombus pyrosoma]XP_043586786.1 uncharacterized protein LOC122569595 isoform X1 [Bombus pyrosoma]
MTDIVVFLVVLIAVNPLNALQVPFTCLDLSRELQQCVDLIAIEELLEISKAYLAQDEHFQTVMKLMNSNESKQWVQDVEQAPEFKVLLNYTQGNGFDVNSVVNNFNKALSIRPLTSRITAYLTPYKVTGGINGYMEDTASLISMDDLTRLYEDKIEHAKVFRDFVHEVVLNKYLTFYMSIFSNKNFLQVGQQVVNAGFNIEIFQALSPFLLIISIAV